MIALKILSKILKALASQASPNQLAWGFVLGMLLGLTPFWGLYSVVVIVLVLILRVNISMAIAGWLIFALIGLLLDPLLHSMGYWLLVRVEALSGLWIWLSESAVLAWLHSNNTVMLASFVLGLVLILPVYLGCKKFVVFYREQLNEKILKLKIVKILMGTKLYSLFNKALKLRG